MSDMILDDEDYQGTEIKIPQSIAIRIIEYLKKMPIAKSFDGEYSCQVLIPIGENRNLRFGTTDDDVGFPGLWIDEYPSKRFRLPKDQSHVD